MLCLHKVYTDQCVLMQMCLPRGAFPNGDISPLGRGGAAPLTDCVHVSPKILLQSVLKAGLKKTTLKF